MKILVLNCGSSSLKFQLLNMDNEKVIAKGVYERIAIGKSFLTYKKGEEKHVFENPVDNHDDAIKFVLEQLLDSTHGVISNLEEISAVGHRIVHGGEKFKTSVVINEEVIEEIKKCVPLAPLHNPAGILGIEACKKLMPNVNMVAVFDTSFHQTIPEKAYIYPLPYEYYEKHGIRKYGFHGTSHKYVANRVAELMNKKPEEINIINCHLGQGASIAAIQKGKCIDTSMGLTPLAGIPMGTRSGDIDPAIVTFLMEKENLSIEEVNNILNKKSGVFGISKLSGDFRDVEDGIANGNKNAELSLDIYNYLVAQFIGKYIVSLGGVDVITFTAGVGENGPETRRDICKYLKFMGVKIDAELNKARGKEAKVSTDDSNISIYVVPTNEELMIAKDTLELIK